MTLYRRKTLNKKTNKIEIGKIWHYEFLTEGQRYRGSTNCTSKATAQDVESAIRSDILRGKFEFKGRARKSITFNALAEKYLEWSKTNKKAWMWDVYIIRNLSKFFGSMKLSEIEKNTFIVEKYRNRRRKGEFGQKIPQESTINRELSRLRAILNKGIEWGYIETTPFRRGVKLNLKAEKR